MRAPMFAPPPPFDAQERVTHRLLDSSPLFDEYAATIGDGWQELLAAAARVDAEHKRIFAASRTADSPVQAIAAAIFEDSFDLDDHVAALREGRAAHALGDERVYVLKMARMALLDAAHAWLGAHGTQLLDMVQTRRLAIQAELRDLVNGDLEGMTSPRELAHRPQHVEAYGHLQALLAEWQRLRDLHAGVIQTDRQDVLWFGASWVHNYADLWQDLRQEPNVTPPWQTSDEFALAHLIAGSIEVWTPSLDQLDQHVAHLTKAAERRREERLAEANRHASVPR